MSRLEFDTYEVVILSAEFYMNRGITRDQIKDVIQRQYDGHAKITLVTSGGINGNWKFRLWFEDPELVVMRIQLELDRLLRSKVASHG